MEGEEEEEKEPLACGDWVKRKRLSVVEGMREPVEGRKWKRRGREEDGICIFFYLEKKIDALLFSCVSMNPGMELFCF